MVHKIVHKVWVYDFLTIYNVWLCSSEVGNIYIIRNCLLISIHVETMHAAHMLNSLITLLMLQNCSHSKLLPHNICSTQVYSVFTEIIVIRFHVPPRFLDILFSSLFQFLQQMDFAEHLLERILYRHDKGLNTAAFKTIDRWHDAFDQCTKEDGWWFGLSTALWS